MQMRRTAANKYRRAGRFPVFNFVWGAARRPVGAPSVRLSTGWRGWKKAAATAARYQRPTPQSGMHVPASFRPHPLWGKADFLRRGQLPHKVPIFPMQVLSSLHRDAARSQRPVPYWGIIPCGRSFFFFGPAPAFSAGASALPCVNCNFPHAPHRAILTLSS